MELHRVFRTLLRLLAIPLLLTACGAAANGNAAPGAPGSRGAPDANCRDGGTRELPWKACIEHPAAAGDDIVYFLHGLGGSERDWIVQGAPLRERWAARGEKPPTVVAISYGPAWLLAPEDSASPGAVLTRTIIEGILPELESSLGGLRGKRFLVGASMGGFNATQLLLRHPELFDRVALLCPALTTLSPFATADEIAAYERRTGANPDRVNTALGSGRLFFPQPAVWDAASPFGGSRGRLGSETPHLLVSIGQNDDFGFQEGAEAFVDLARGQGVRDVRWLPVPGPHCRFDVEALSRFLVEPLI